MRKEPRVTFDDGTRWGDGILDATIRLSDHIEGLRHEFILGTDGSFADYFPLFGLRFAVGGFIKWWPHLTFYGAYGEDDE